MQSTPKLLNNLFADSEAYQIDFDKFIQLTANQSKVLSTSFSKEDQIITHLIFSNNYPIDIFTLDTGRLFPETYSVWSRTVERYQKSIKSYFPNSDELSDMLDNNGPNLFYESSENRKKCCQIRKVNPLKKALIGYDIWITGIRASQSANRKSMPLIEVDDTNQIIKIHPLMNWSDDQIQKAIDKYEIIVNPLYNKGFASIGCAPCTRAIQEGEDERSGRWWWEDSNKKECGLHTK
ncbi:MAG: phosphoadenylyl-sulfate reductase [Flavobacteriales bacterium]